MTAVVTALHEPDQIPQQISKAERIRQTIAAAKSEARQDVTAVIGEISALSLRLGEIVSYGDVIQAGVRSHCERLADFLDKEAQTLAGLSSRDEK